MAPEPWVARLARPLVPAVLAVALMAPQAHALRILSWNILNYPGSTGPARDSLYRRVIGPLSPDIVVTGETTSQTGVNEFLGSVLNTLEPGQWSAATFVDGNDTDMGFFYRTSKVQFLGQWGFYPDPTTNLRLTHVYRLKPVGYTSGATEIRIFAFHLKASQGSACSGIPCETRRLNECIGIRDSMNAAPPGTHIFALGDFNFYAGDGTEPGYGKMLESQANNIGRLYDPLPGMSGIHWQDNTSIQPYWTQSPCGTGDTGCASGASTGGLDDRFDLILPSTNWQDGSGYALVPGSYISVGNDGLHHNNGINAPPTIPEGTLYANALHAASDHLPVRLDLQVPSRMTVSGGPFALGNVIVGASAQTEVTVGNPAVAPADSLNYSIASSGDFSTPPGPFARAAEAGSDSRFVTMDTATPGNKSGGVVITSDAPDSPTFNIPMSGTVLRHAVASIDSGSVVTSGTLDFGVQDPGGFSDQSERLHNYGWDGLQAALAVSAATITGGDGRFTLVGGTAPTTLGGIGETYTVHFDDTDATRDSLYEATLTFQSGDEALPGATALPDLNVTLQAKLTPGSTTGVEHPGAPAATRLYAPAPNPLRGSSLVRFDLARSGSVRLEVFDLSGRRVTTLASGEFQPGRFSVRWDGASENGGRAGAGLYFVRLTAPGLSQTARLAIVN